ncbi:DUF2267 domain-containing protein [Phytoactinopolyspora halotolerans]|uniref:DUF2267 domain-containing protein n=1 Tax=Phytoactinopolyspora halotolerans TaxID=1981512 RepID=A0A6L9S308_9ACTN|nr:DUF2267 domain-containing protein [Phytoactinopolyspora halotolerans]NED99442.1 DUF2267 domain-containing protein [Phytoactinopolyspora halotolerans]
MQHDEFIGHVQHRAQLSSRGDAERATRATLETLGERVTGGLATNLAAQLPEEIGEHLRRTVPFGADDAPGERFEADEFIRRVAARSTTDEPQAAYLARVVFEVTDEATQGSVTSKVAETLPDDIRSLITAGSSGHA